MDKGRIENAVQRIEAALARIGRAADAARPTPPSVSALVVKHEELRDSVTTSLEELDELIGALEQ